VNHKNNNNKYGNQIRQQVNRNVSDKLQRRLGNTHLEQMKWGDNNPIMPDDVRHAGVIQSAASTTSIHQSHRYKNTTNKGGDIRSFVEFLFSESIKGRNQRTLGSKEILFYRPLKATRSFHR